MSEPRIYYLDITPIIRGPLGERFALGTVRYEVTDGMVGDMGPLPYELIMTMPPESAFPIAHYPTYITYKCTVSWAGMPQPEPLKVRSEDEDSQA